MSYQTSLLQAVRSLRLSRRVNVSTAFAVRPSWRSLSSTTTSTDTPATTIGGQDGDLPATATTSSSGSTVDTSTLLDQFRDPLSLVERFNTPVGRSWHAKELRRKSFQDLHKLWLVLYKERNMLGTEKYLCRVNELPFPQEDRMRKVKKSMGAIKQVLGERKRDKIAAKWNELYGDNDDDEEEEEEDGYYDEEEGEEEEGKETQKV